METWKTMVEKSVDVNKGTWRFIVQALSKGGFTKEVLFHSPLSLIFLSYC
jgi:hypothetical protein